jgi:asparagine synthetase B (glutamine-hydrolysing)
LHPAFLLDTVSPTCVAQRCQPCLLGRGREAAARKSPEAHDPDFGCSAGDLADRRNEFDNHPALRVEGHRFPIETFSISFRGRSFDEAEFIDRAVKEYGTDHEVLDLTSAQDLCGAIEEFAYPDEPSVDVGSLPVWFLSKLCKSKTAVALNGEETDDLFGGYITCRTAVLARWARRMPRQLFPAALVARDAQRQASNLHDFDIAAHEWLRDCFCVRCW